jgi:DNA ligase 1
MLLANVVETSAQVAEARGRLRKVELIADLLKQVSAEEAEIVVAILSGAVRQGRIGLGYATIRNSSAVPAVTPTLEVLEVDQALSRIATIKGSGSEQERRRQLQSLLERATAPEQEFLAGLLLGNLRQGALEGIMLDAVARASGVALAKVRRASMMAGDIPRVARLLLESGEAGIADFDIQLFQPVHPMLAQPAADAAAALAELGEAALEYKLDGVRVQVHRKGGEVRVYTRALNEVTQLVPEIVDAVKRMPAEELILDGEIIAFRDGGRPQPFQITMRRFGRHLDERLRAELPLTPAWFDLLYLNAASFIDRPQRERFTALKELVPPEHLVTHTLTGNIEVAEGFMRASLDAGHEGLLAKNPDSPYAAGARGQNWLKLKKAHTLDLVVLAAEWGSGRRKGWLSNLHLGARDTKQGGFAMLGKTFKGLTDEMLRWQTERFLSLEISRDSYTVYIKPEVVVEIAYSDLQVSTRYVSGLALRFARVKRYRTDKAVADADTFETVQKLAGMSR